MKQKSVANVNPQPISVIVSVSFLYKTTQKKNDETHELLSAEDTIIFAMIFLDRAVGKKCKIK